MYVYKLFEFVIESLTEHLALSKKKNNKIYFTTQI